MRILHVTPYYEEAWGYGGIPRVVGAIARGQARAGHEVVVCTTDARDGTGRAGAGGSAGVEVRAFPNWSNRAAYRFQLFAPRGMRGWLRANAGSFEVVHVHAHRNLPELWAARACAAAGVPLVLSPHGTAPRIERRRLAKLLLDAALGSRLLQAAQRVLCVSESESRDLRALGVKQEALRVVGNPVELPEVVPDGRAFRARHGLQDAPLVAFLGRITPRKQVDTLLTAFAALPDCRARLVLAGNAPGMEGGLTRLSRRLGVSDRVLRIEQLEGPDRFGLLAAADAVAYPGGQEVFGLVAFEALACGAPVVVAGDSGCGEILGALGGVRCVPPADSAALSRALAEMLRERARFRDAARVAAVEVRERFSPDAVAARVCRVYEELAQRPSPERPRR